MKIFTPQQPANIVRSLALAIVVVLIIGVNLARFYKTEQIPYGFHVDELSGAVTIACLETQGVDAHNHPFPLFGDLNYGTPKPPTYMYPAAGWAKLFGASVSSLRIFTAVTFVLSLLGLFFLAHFLRGAECALWSVLAGSISPWMWPLSRVALESLMAPMFMIWGLYVFLRFRPMWAAAVAGILFSCVLYSYPPFRLYIPLMLVPLWFYTCKTRPVSRAFWILFLCAMILPTVPLAQKIINGEAQARFNKISITSTEYLRSVGKTHSPKDILQVFIGNYFLHISPEFLFFKGDSSLVHSTRRFGILSWLDMLGLFFLILLIGDVFFRKLTGGRFWRTEGPFLLFISVNILLGIVPSALTNTELPNSLRIVAAWPFVSLLTGYGIWHMSLRWPSVVPIASVLTAAIFAGVFLKVFFYQYPSESAGMFSFWTKVEAEHIKDDQGWLQFLYHYRNDDYHSRYFLMNYHGDSCRGSKDIWDNLKKVWIAKGIN